MRSLCLWLLLAALVGGVAACGNLTPVGAVYNTAVDERSYAQQSQDRGIRTSIESDYATDSDVSYFGISVFVYLNDVYLVGTYDNAQEKDRAIQIARGTDGVRRVYTYLLPSSASSCDFVDKSEVRADLNYELYGTKGVTATNIDVATPQCNVVLLGIVGSQAEIDKAIAVAKKVQGVREVKSFLRTMPRAGGTAPSATPESGTATGRKTSAPSSTTSSPSSTGTTSPAKSAPAERTLSQ
ncbi:transport-associated protein [Desulfovibrio sp. X2]|uniref:BON domain-containing protein n=1 Tax=Desulfovibrio sp. X2 TaxID=941449 RepID=UPI000358D43A|nr:BON domain-containing protein [Desulfovibrio sp. X2]EPR44326.1 transport-associated protein [Desulfovibrio sp. X2]